MEFIDVNSHEHRKLMIKAINDKNVYLLNQLNGVAESGCSQIVILDTFFDLFMYSTFETEEPVYEVITDKHAIPLFFREDLKDIDMSEK